MSDGKITGRLIRQRLHMHKNNETGTLFITLVKHRGKYTDNSGESKRAKSDFLTFEYFMDNSPASQRRTEMLISLVDDRTLVELEYSLKSTTYKDVDNNNVSKEYKQLVDFEILESKQAVKDRVVHKDVPDPDEAAFNPDEAGAFIELGVEEHLIGKTPKTKDKGKFGNPFER